MIYIGLISLSAAVMLGLAYYCRQRRSVPGGGTFSLVLLMGGAWMLAITLMLASQTQASALFWNRIETYIHNHSEAEFSHGLCPECMDKMYGQQDWYKKRDKK